MNMKMASSILRWIPQRHLGRILVRRAGMSTLTGSGGVCSAPWLMLLLSSVQGGGTAYSMYSPFQGKVVRLEPAENKNKVVGSSHGWLALFNEGDSNLFLWNPITHRNIKLPPPQNFEFWSPQYKLYNLSHFPNENENLNSRGCVSEVMISCPLDREERERNECVAMMTYDSGDGKKELAFCFPGRSTNWTLFGGDARDINVVYLNRSKRFLTLDEWNVGFSMRWLNLDYVSSTFPCFEGKHLYKIPKDLLQRRYVVSAGAANSDHLFLVTRLLGDSYQTVDFLVHRMSFGDDRFRIECCMKESLDGLVMFVGPNHSSSAVVAADFPELKPNSIYFTGDDTGVFDYENKTISPVYYPKDDDHVQTIRPKPSPFWFTPTAKI